MSETRLGQAPPREGDTPLRSALMRGPRPQRIGPAGASFALGWRALLKLRYRPAQLWDALALPVMMTLMFSFLFGGAIAGGSAEYVQYFVPGTMVMALILTTAYTGRTLKADISKGIFDRFRSLRMWRPAVVVGLLIGEALRYALAVLAVLALGLLLGMRPEGGAVGTALALALLVLFGLCMAWLWTTIGMLAKTPDAVLYRGMPFVFPLLFLSNVFVEPETMPEWLQGFVNLNPVSHMAGAVRALLGSTATWGDIAPALLGCAVLAGVFAPLTMYLFNRRQ
ncbi:ABC-2 type transport system permease protein [Nocardiopsis mwathae]|uniref:Transport permease protein n=1 Tax=Nocardiopsis mwathae TaxID=1472723 RepID=A0A7X0D812_9ACTN|nr:ABC transporter permease [Nocardiopsis mwathae]MBB6174905.1 ABC-2 type transport system permease protein [Nocardiopsis mwathae]